MSSENSDSDTDLVLFPRKRPRNQELWKANRAKANRNSGNSYIPVGKHIEMNAASIGPLCKCRKKCLSELGEATVLSIFNKFWAIGDFNLQNQYLVLRDFFTFYGTSFFKAISIFFFIFFKRVQYYGLLSTF